MTHITNLLTGLISRMNESSGLNAQHASGLRLVQLVRLLSQDHSIQERAEVDKNITDYLQWAFEIALGYCQRAHYQPLLQVDSNFPDLLSYGRALMACSPPMKLSTAQTVLNTTLADVLEIQFICAAEDNYEPKKAWDVVDRLLLSVIKYAAYMEHDLDRNLGVRRVKSFRGLSTLSFSIVGEL